MIVDIPGFDIALTADSGQCFRFDRVSANTWQVVAAGRVLRVRDLGQGRFDLDCGLADFDALWRDYFDLSRDYALIHQAVPEEDLFLSAALRYAGGLRVLRQEPFETLISFIISQRKNIPAIKGCVQALCQRFGAPIGGGLFAFPEPEALAAASLEDLKACALGYRSRYILETSRLVAEGRVDLAALASLDDAGLLAALVALPGVGVKVANCVMLFGYHRVDAFPRDVWIDRVIVHGYGGDFPLSRHAGHAGILQQMMFCYARGPWWPGIREKGEADAQPSDPHIISKASKARKPRP